MYAVQSQYRWYLVGILNPTESTDACRDFETASRRFIIYDSADHWYVFVQKTVLKPKVSFLSLIH